MRKMIYILAFIAVALFIVIAFDLSNVYSQKETKDTNVNNVLVKTIQLKYGHIDVSHDHVNISKPKLDSDGFSRIEVYDKNSGKFIEAYGVKEEPLDVSSYTNKVSKVTIYKERKDYSAVTRLYVVLTVYSDSLRQIKSIDKTYWQKVDDGDWQLKNPHAVAISTTGIFPSKEIEASGTATIEMKANIFTVGILNKSGFNVFQSGENGYYLRKTVELGFRYSLV
ncbi:hypothetical protein Thexy_2323 [Thermoanaerobacterium xylanolyticum LX-11]|uniref:Uncharacterized protein n=2 Tax=Thermoanaerobacterium xylanolyticum TaxID=29329 RepID=F6BLX3_THEXL|nr:hypothetical protein Thexy_2323 [Thermoanaerobacterium xylanolyticum LX-11]